MQTRLASWKNCLLNRTCRLALATSVLSSIPSYYMQINWLPQNICDSIDQPTRNFIWRGSSNKGIHLVGWKKITNPKCYGGLGIRTVRHANICLLGKLVWDMVQSTNMLWVHLLSTKYSSSSKILQAKAASSNSPFWASIIRAKDILKSGYSWRPGSGSTSFWFSNWCHHGPLGYLVPVIDIHDIHLTVRDVITFDGRHTQALYTTLPQAVADTVNNFQANFNPIVDDTFIWNHNKNDVYSTKSGYSWLLSSSEAATVNTLHHSWTWIWKLKVPEKYKFLIWLAIHDVVPTLSLMHHRNIVVSAICGRCNDQEESFLHCIRDCKFSKPVWQQFGLSDIQFFAINCAHEWIKGNAKGPRAYIFLACLWWIWRHRNNMCLNNDTWSLTRLSSIIHNSAETNQQAFQTATTTANLDQWIRWNNNNFNYHILNIDGSCLGTQIRAGYGGLIRNNAGLFLKGFSGYIQASTCILLSELTTIHMGLSLAADMGIEDLVCFSDSQLYVNLITGAVSKFHAYAVLIQDIKDLLASRNFNIFHTFRERNQCADFLAKLGASSHVCFLEHQSPPHDLVSLLWNDAMGTAFLRI